jgi:hypothetical protein
MGGRKFRLSARKNKERKKFSAESLVVSVALTKSIMGLRVSIPHHLIKAPCFDASHGFHRQPTFQSGETTTVVLHGLLSLAGPHGSYAVILWNAFGCVLRGFPLQTTTGECQ